MVLPASYRLNGGTVGGTLDPGIDDIVSAYPWLVYPAGYKIAVIENMGAIQVSFVFVFMHPYYDKIMSLARHVCILPFWTCRTSLIHLT